MTSLRRLAKPAFCLPVAALLLLPATASALEVGVRVEPGLALPLTAPQTPRFTPGGEISLKGYLGLGRYFDVQAGATFLGLGAAEGTMPTTVGTAWSTSLGFRLQRPHDASLAGGGFAAASPWIDGDALYVKTGGLDRFGVTLGAGVSFPLTLRRNAWLGPFVRYMQILQPSREGFDSGDARILFLGLNLELGTSPLPPPVVALPQPTFEPPPVVARPPPPPVVAPPPPALVVPPDRDHDGLSDDADTCPDVAGPVENQGCPVYKKVIVKRDKLELGEKIMFAFDRADIKRVSLPLLDEVVQALKDNKGFHVQIEGHTDSRGPTEHNQTLSENRAEAVLNYVREHGITPDRLASKGFGSSVPTDSNTTAAGRENNRRVEFVVLSKTVDRSAH